MSNGVNGFLGDTPVRVAIKLLIARCYIGLKQIGWAERTINEILRLDPDNHEARELMALY